MVILFLMVVDIEDRCFHAGLGRQHIVCGDFIPAEDDLDRRRRLLQVCPKAWALAGNVLEKRIHPCHCKAHRLLQTVLVWRLEHMEAMPRRCQRDSEGALLPSASLVFYVFAVCYVLYLGNAVLTVARHGALQAPALRRWLGRGQHVLLKGETKNLQIKPDKLRECVPEGIRLDRCTTTYDNLKNNFFIRCVRER